jgi:hypothetical protein
MLATLRYGNHGRTEGALAWIIGKYASERPRETWWSIGEVLPAARSVAVIPSRRIGLKLVAGPKSLGSRERRSSVSFGLYIVGYLIVICGLAYGAVLMHVPTHWIFVGGIVLTGLAIVTGVKATRSRDSANKT